MSGSVSRQRTKNIKPLRCLFKMAAAIALASLRRAWRIPLDIIKKIRVQFGAVNKGSVIGLTDRRIGKLITRLNFGFFLVLFSVDRNRFSQISRSKKELK